MEKNITQIDAKLRNEMQHKPSCCARTSLCKSYLSSSSNSTIAQHRFFVTHLKQTTFGNSCFLLILWSHQIASAVTPIVEMLFTAVLVLCCVILAISNRMFYLMLHLPLGVMKRSHVCYSMKAQCEQCDFNNCDDWYLRVKQEGGLPVSQ